MKSMILGIAGIMTVIAATILLFAVQNDGIQYAWIAFIGAGLGLIGLCMPEPFACKILSLIALLGGLAIGGIWLVIYVFINALTAGIGAATSGASNQ